MKQKGAILLSTLIFLVIVLILLKIVLNSAFFSEKKAGIYDEIHNATTSAQRAVRAGEQFILEAANKMEAAGLIECSEDADHDRCIEELASARYQYWHDLSKNELGIYLSEDSSCTISNDTQALWQCADWGDEFNHYLAAAPRVLPTRAVNDANLLSAYDARYMIVLSHYAGDNMQFSIIGFGTGRNVAPDGNLTNSLLSATYILVR